MFYKKQVHLDLTTHTSYPKKVEFTEQGVSVGFFVWLVGLSLLFWGVGFLVVVVACIVCFLLLLLLFSLLLLGLLLVFWGAVSSFFLFFFFLLFFS